MHRWRVAAATGAQSAWRVNAVDLGIDPNEISFTTVLHATRDVSYTITITESNLPRIT